MSQSMHVKVELYGIPRQLAGTNQVQIELEKHEATLGGLMRELQRRFPSWPTASEPLDVYEFPPSFVANLGGERFVRDPHIAIHDATTVLIMSADAGG